MRKEYGAATAISASTFFSSSSFLYSFFFPFLSYSLRRLSNKYILAIGKIKKPDMRVETRARGGGRGRVRRVLVNGIPLTARTHSMYRVHTRVPLFFSPSSLFPESFIRSACFIPAVGIFDRETRKTNAYETEIRAPRSSLYFTDEFFGPIVNTHPLLYARTTWC